MTPLVPRCRAQTLLRSRASLIDGIMAAKGRMTLSLRELELQYKQYALLMWHNKDYSQPEDFDVFWTWMESVIDAHKNAQPAAKQGSTHSASHTHSSSFVSTTEVNQHCSCWDNASEAQELLAILQSKLGDEVAHTQAVMRQITSQFGAGFAAKVLHDISGPVNEDFMAINVALSTCARLQVHATHEMRAFHRLIHKFDQELKQLQDDARRSVNGINWEDTGCIVVR